jgi:hypothetical protein
MAKNPNFSYQQSFSTRHNQSNPTEIKEILQELGLD